MEEGFTLSREEYLALRRLIDSERESEGASLASKLESSPGPRTRKKTKRDRAMSRGLREAQAKARKKNGSWKKGWNQSRVMKEAHRLARKYGPSTKKGMRRKTARRAYRR